MSPRASAEQPPLAQGGLLIFDATFDLTEIVVYGQVAEPPSPQRAAFRFFDGGDRAEYAIEIPEDPTEPPRRIVSVNPGTTLSELEFYTTCPGEWQEQRASFVRGFTVTETGLALYDGNTAFVFTRR